MKIGEKGLIHQVLSSTDDNLFSLLRRLEDAGVRLEEGVREKVATYPATHLSIHDIVIFDGHSFSHKRLSYEILMFEASRNLLSSMCIEAALELFSFLKPEFMRSFDLEAVIAFHNPYTAEGKRELLALFHEENRFVIRMVTVPDRACNGQKCWAYAFERF